MTPGASTSHSTPPALHAPGWRALLQALKWTVAALLAYAIWRMYQSPDFMLELSSWRLC